MITPYRKPNKNSSDSIDAEKTNPDHSTHFDSLITFMPRVDSRQILLKLFALVYSLTFSGSNQISNQKLIFDSHIKPL